MAKAAWQGDDWDRISSPHAEMGSPVIDRLELLGDERVLDAGCGSGRVTERLVERLPDGRVVALDGSSSMIREARERLARFGDRVTFVRASLDEPPLPIGDPVDAAISTATFHWVLDHDALFSGLATAIRPGGQLSFQCGGAGNAEAMITAARAEGAETAQMFHMAGVDETTQRLDGAGFAEIRAWLEPVTVEFQTRDEMLDYIVVPYLRPALGWPEDELYELAAAIADRLGGRAIDYVRLNVTALRR